MVVAAPVVDVAVAVVVVVALAYTKSTASPVKGAVKLRVPPPSATPPATTVPVAGLNHSTVRVPVVLDMSTAADPPAGR